LCKNYESYTGFLIPNPEDCFSYYQCQANYTKKRGYEAVLKHCPKGTGFDTKLGGCNHLSYLPRACFRGL
jgi:hypothetical protein